MIRKILALFLIIMINSPICFAELIIDDSIHSKISKDYDLEKLPDLPSNLQNSTVETIFTPNEFDTEPSSKYTPTPEKTTTQNDSPSKDNTTAATPPKTNPTSAPTVQNTSGTNKTYRAITIKKGKKIKVVNSKALSDTMPKGTSITFASTSNNKQINLPQNTVFKGTVIDSHSPNLTGNGGLLVIKVNQIYFNGGWYPVNANIALANQKKVFFNNIKGKRMYFKNAKAKTAFGKKTYDKMWEKTKKYFKPGIEILITPITFLTGAVVYATNIAVSPILAIFTKGGKLTIPQNSAFEIKFLEDVTLYK